MIDFNQLISTFVDPIALIMALVLAASILRRKQITVFKYNIAVGGLFSVAVVYTMSDPIPIYSGGIYDMRFLLVGAATALINPYAGGMAMMTSIIYRIAIGGDGVAPGIGGSVIAFMAGWAWRYYVNDLPLADWKKASILGGMLTLHSLSIFLAPQTYWGQLFATLLPYMAMTNVVGALLIKHLLYDQLSFLSQSEGLRSEAALDYLTGLLNRRSLERRYRAVAARNEMLKGGLSAVYFDVDNFKAVNDKHGHAAGDEVLRTIARRVAAVLREHDIFARVSGDEFVIILPDIGLTEAQNIAERCRRVIADRFVTTGSLHIPVTISLGAIWVQDSPTIDAVLQQADKALYRAKDQGRNVVVFSKSGNKPHPQDPVAA
ncbi:diguanylate cyclase [Yoonia sp. SS1-5]|uniref:diguanylate cyclase n=1 Tax=Yoonia rhodophyticola TaxID=3137370 RepID=A0AAN0M9D0_9RHOB